MSKNKNYEVQGIPRMFQQVANELVNYITSEELPKGTKIPTERNLSELLGVSRSSIREGIRVLELLGYLDSRQGEGTFVSEALPYLTPYQVLRLKLDENVLKDYYEIFIMCSQQIVFLSFADYDLSHESHSFSIQDIDQSNSFWDGLYEWIRFLADGIPNKVLVSLWLTNYEILKENGYFAILHSKVNIGEYVNCYLKKDKEKLKELFMILSSLKAVMP